jgi:predicted negative regulator of RcsB-dependent stress response
MQRFTTQNPRYAIYPKADDRKKRKIAFFAFILLATAFFGWIYYNERMVSSKVKAAVRVVVNTPKITDTDLEDNLRTAKLESRTKKDADVVARLDKMVSLMRQSSFDQARGQDSRVIDTLSKAINGCSKLADKSCQKLQQSLTEFTEQSRQLLEKSKEEQAEAQTLSASLRLDVGLPPRPVEDEP